MRENVVESCRQGQPSEVVGVDLHVAAVVRKEVVGERVRPSAAVDVAATDADVTLDVVDAGAAGVEPPGRGRSCFEGCAVRVERHGRRVDIAGELGPVGPDLFHFGLPVSRTVGGVEFCHQVAGAVGLAGQADDQRAVGDDAPRQLERVALQTTAVVLGGVGRIPVCGLSLFGWAALRLRQGGEHVVDILVVRIVTGFEYGSAERARAADECARSNGFSGERHWCQRQQECANEGESTAPTDHRAPGCSEPVLSAGRPHV